MGTFTQEDVAGQDPEKIMDQPIAKAEEQLPAAEVIEEGPIGEEGEQTVEEDILADADTPVDVELPVPHGTQTAANLGLQSDASGSYTTNRD